MSGPADAIIDMYRRHAVAWTRARSGTRFYEKEWLDTFRELLETGATVLDIGCGSGEPMARYFVDRGYAIFGVDSSPEMIDIFRRNFPDTGAEVADMRSLKLGRSFGGLLAWDSFFHLSPEHQRLMFPIFRDHAAPRASLIFTSGPSYGEAIGTLEGEPLYHASLDGAEYRRLLDQNGFEVMAHLVEDPNCGRHTVWLAQHR